MSMLNREGIFLARPVAWGLQPSKNSKSQAVFIEFLVEYAHNGTGWDDWRDYEDQTITGYFYIVKKDGTVNSTQVEILAEALGWDGSPGALLNDPPNVRCQITTENETYEGKTRLKVKWLNHESYTPGVQGASAEEVSSFGTQFGSLLRAAAAGGIARNRAMAPKRETPPPPAEAPVPVTAPGGDDTDEDLPF